MTAKVTQARAKGTTIAQTLESDRVAPPKPLLDHCNPPVGSDDIDVSRYTSAEFFQREVDQLWNRCWQWACRLEHIQDVGDSWVYNIGPYSVIVVRSGEDTVQAFLNSCTHRGTKLFSGEGSRYTQAFTCPFHGWSWELDGDVRNIPGRWDFPHVTDESHRLHEIRCELWQGFVFINLDANAKPLAEYLGVLPEHFSHFPLEQRRIRVHVEKKLPANWKAAQEAFMEAYHNFETHDSPNGGNAQYDVFGKYVSRFIHNIGAYCPESLEDYPGSKWRRPPLTEEEQLQILAAFGHQVESVPEGETARAVAAADLRQRLGEQFGTDLSEVSDAVMLDSIEYHLFPNMFFFPGVSIPMVYRFRPDGDNVDSCVFSLLILEPLADGAPHPEPPEPVELDVEQSYTEVEELVWLGQVYDEDTSNLDMQQQGFKTSGKQGITLGNYQESRIRRVHMTLDEFMDEGKNND
jgi:phenylpropionate dioxygenase-like ring-hydroxylating dioxygenase large terminal subunit